MFFKYFEKHLSVFKAGKSSWIIFRSSVKIASHGGGAALSTYSIRQYINFYTYLLIQHLLTTMRFFRNLLFLAVFLSGCSTSTETIIVYSADFSESIDFGIEQLNQALQKDSLVAQTTNVASNDATFELLVTDAIANEINDGYTIERKEIGWRISAECDRGIMYGLMDVANQLKAGVLLENLEEKDKRAHYPFRAIKFNLPWYSYRHGENLDLHYETCRDLKYWEAFLNMMVENKFNTLTLWNMHPFIYMVQPESFPDASPFSEEEMNEWKEFWKSLFKLAKERGIETYVMNWNIFISEEFSTNYDVAGYNNSEGYIGDGQTNELIEKYTRELVTQTINEYDDLTGLGITLGERMGGMTSLERKEWIDRTIIKGMKDANRKARLIYRAPLSADKNSGGSTSVSTEKITREAVEALEFDKNVFIEFKYNWSHGHSSPKVSIVHGGILTDTYWQPAPKKYKGVWTVRNEDFFVLRWAQPDFIRAFLKNNSQDYIAGTLIGSETYIPAKDYITKEAFRTWDYAFERQWLFYEVWGNLLFDETTPDSYFSHSLENKFGIENGDDLLLAWKLASNTANRFASFYRGTWDATLYSEGFTKIGGEFIDINSFITNPVLDSFYINIEDFVNEIKLKENQQSPLQLADDLEKDSKQALSIVANLRGDKVSQELEIELADIAAWSYHANYLAAKIKGGVALARFRRSGDSKEKDAAIQHLQHAMDHWLQLTDEIEKYNAFPIPYQFDQHFSWRKHIVDVEKDIKIASGSSHNF